MKIQNTEIEFLSKTEECVESHGGVIHHHFAQFTATPKGRRKILIHITEEFDKHSLITRVTFSANTKTISEQHKLLSVLGPKCSFHRITCSLLDTLSQTNKEMFSVVFQTK